MFSPDFLFPYSRPFNRLYRCFSISMLPDEKRSDVNKGGKVILPPSALDHLTRLSIVYPMLFKLTNTRTNRVTHCGVLEFVAEEGKIFIPYWMMVNLILEEGELLQVESAALPVASFSKFQPQSKDFLDITNQKAVLESALRNFACLTVGDMFAIEYNNKIYELRVLETQPENAVTIIECDMNVEFASPPDYDMQEPTSKIEETDSKQNRNIKADTEIQCAGFTGRGYRLDGKEKGTDSDDPPIKSQYKRGIPDFDYKIGTLQFIRISPSQDEEKDIDMENFMPFQGVGKPLRDKKI